jgi:hypothetical protein
MSTHNINGKDTSVGDKVLYTAHDGRKHTLAIKNLTQSYADLEGTVDGTLQNFTSVPHHISGSAHTWNHIENSVTTPVPGESTEEPGYPTVSE